MLQRWMAAFQVHFVLKPFCGNHSGVELTSMWSLSCILPLSSITGISVTRTVLNTILSDGIGIKEVVEVLIIYKCKLQVQFDKHLSMCSDKTAFMCYNGTSLRCRIYDNITTTCDTKLCGVCGIIQNGLLEKYTSANITYQRFGVAS